jgi:hypothetical protein
MKIIVTEKQQMARIPVPGAPVRAVSKLGREVHAALPPLSATSKKWASLIARQTVGENA